MSDKFTIRLIKEIELEDIRTIIVSPKIEYNKECIKNIRQMHPSGYTFISNRQAANVRLSKGIIKKYIEHKLKS